MKFRRRWNPPMKPSRSKKMIEPKELTVLKTKVSKLENNANAVVINSAEDYASAIDLVSKLKETGSNIKQIKESITKPLNEALKNARNIFAPLEVQFTSAESIIKGKLLTYKQKVDAEAKAKEDAIAKKVEDGKMSIDTAEKKMDKIERVDQTTKGKVGEVQVRKVKKIRITDEALLPRQYLVPDQVAIRRDALSGIVIQGVEVYEEETIAAGRY
ncbi:MAG TPA: hypothetical protein VIU13_14325 [Chryseolinea sp.]